MSVLDQLLVLPQHVLPQRALSHAVRWITRQEWPAVVPRAIRSFCTHYRVSLDEAQVSDPEAYPSFNAFFTRALKPGARPIADAAVVSPADGKISQLGRIEQGRLIQAKGKTFSLEALLGGDTALAAKLDGGCFAVIYLAPRDYHRVHSAVDCTVDEVCFVPGLRYSVNDRTSRVVDGLYARNERVVLSGQCGFGPCAQVLVGAMLVSSMSVKDFDLETLERGATAAVRETLPSPLRRARGEELGRFNMGSTVVLVLPPGAPGWATTLAAGQPVVMGQRLSEG